MTFAEFGFTLEDYITKELKLELSRGGRYVCCPLHDENTASFRIYDDEDTFYCFGCNIGGDVVVLHQKLALREGRNISYGTALGEVRNIVYRHTGNEKVLEREKRRIRGDYEIDGNRVIARLLPRKEAEEANESVESVEEPTGNEKKKRSALETLKLMQRIKGVVRKRELDEAQRLLFLLENGNAEDSGHE